MPWGTAATRSESALAGAPPSRAQGETPCPTCSRACSGHGGRTREARLCAPRDRVASASRLHERHGARPPAPARRRAPVERAGQARPLPPPLRGDPDDLEVTPAQERPRPDEGPRRELALEVRRVDLVEAVVERQIRAEDLHLDEVVHRQPLELELLLEVVEHRARLLLGIGGRLAGRGIEPEGAGQEDEAARQTRGAERQSVGPTGSVQVLDLLHGSVLGRAGGGAGARENGKRDSEATHASLTATPSPRRAARPSATDPATRSPAGARSGCSAASGPSGSRRETTRTSTGCRGAAAR